MVRQRRGARRVRREFRRSRHPAALSLRSGPAGACRLRNARLEGLTPPRRLSTSNMSVEKGEAHRFAREAGTELAKGAHSKADAVYGELKEAILSGAL